MKIIKKVVSETYRDDNTVLVEQEEQYTYKTEEEALNHTETMTADNWRPSGQTYMNSNGYFVPYRCFYKYSVKGK